MLTKEKIIQKIEENKENIQKFRVRKLVLFGSYAYDEATAESDIDFLVEFKSSGGLFDDYIGLLHFLEDLFHKKIDIGEPEFLREELKPYILDGAKIEAKI